MQSRALSVDEQNTPYRCILHRWYTEWYCTTCGAVICQEHRRAQKKGTPYFERDFFSPSYCTCGACHDVVHEDLGVRDDLGAVLVSLKTGREWVQVPERPLHRPKLRWGALGGVAMTTPPGFRGHGDGDDLVPSDASYDILTAGDHYYNSLDNKNTTVQRSGIEWRTIAHELEADVQIGHHFLEMTCGCCLQVFKRPIGCGDALCTACSKLRQMRYAPMLMDAIEGIWGRKNIAVMITLTLKNNYDVAERLGHLFRTMRALRHRRSNCSRRAEAKRPEWCRVRPEYYGVWGDCVAGGAYAIETTYNPASGYHVHAHILAELESFMDQATLSKEWHDITGDSYIVDIRQIKNGGQAHTEISKYPFKPASEKYLSGSQRSEVRNALRGRRLFTFFGAMYGEHTLEREPGECPGCGEVGTLFASAVNDRWGDRKQLDWIPVTASALELEYARRWGTVQVALDGGAVPNWGGDQEAGGGRLVGEWARWKGRLRAG